MTFQSGATSATRSHHDMMAKITQQKTSQHFESVVIAAAGAGYNVGNILTYTHASGALDAKFEVMAVSATPGPITDIRIESGGAFSDRVASLVVNAGGTGYPASSTVFFRLTDGTRTQDCKFTGTTNGSGVVTAVAVIESGGAYTVDPTLVGAATAIIGPSTATTGSGLTVDVTMQTITGTASLALTGGDGAGAQVNVSLVATGWTSSGNDGYDRHDFSFNGLDDEKEVVMTGTVIGGDVPVVGYRTWTHTSGVTNTGIMVTGMDTVNPSLSLDLQANVIPSSATPATTGGAYVSMLEDTATPFWMQATPRSSKGAVFNDGVATDTTLSWYQGLGNPFGTAIETPLPQMCMGSQSSIAVLADQGGLDQSGICEQFRISTRTGPFYYREPLTGSWQQCFTGSGTAFPVNANTTRGCFPFFDPPVAVGNDDEIVANGNFTFFNSVGRNTGAAATLELRPTPGTNQRFKEWPVTLIRDTEEDVHCELESVFWISGRKFDGTLIDALDSFITVSGRVLRAFRQSNRTEAYSFFCIEEA